MSDDIIDLSKAEPGEPCTAIEFTPEFWHCEIFDKNYKANNGQSRCPYCLKAIRKQKEPNYNNYELLHHTSYAQFHNESAEYIELLKNPAIFTKLTEDEASKKIVGEKDAVKTIFLCAAGGRLVENAKLTSYNLMVNDETGVGKDYVVSCTLELLPSSLWIKKTRISEKVLTYWHNAKFEPDWTWDGRVFYVEDISQPTLNSEVFKVFASSGTDAIVLVKQTPVEVKVNGKPVQIITTAKSVPNEENLRRFPTCNLDSGIEQTKAVIRRRAKFAKDGIAPEYDKDLIAAQRYLKRVKVKVESAEMLAEFFCQKPQLEIIMRTHFDRFLDYIKASAAFHQYQRDTDADGYLVAEDQDYEIARVAFIKISQNPRMIPLTKDDQRILEIISKLPEERSVAELEEHITFLSDKWLRERLDFLADKQFLAKSSKTSEDTKRRVSCYSIVPEGSVSIPTLTELQDFYKHYNDTNTTKTTITSNSQPKQDEIVVIEPIVVRTALDLFRQDGAKGGLILGPDFEYAPADLRDQLKSMAKMGDIFEFKPGSWKLTREGSEETL